MSPPPCSDSPSARSSTSGPGMPDRLSASPTAYLARSNALTSRSVPLRAVPIAVRAAATMTASGIWCSLDVRMACVEEASVPDVGVSLPPRAATTAPRVRPRRAPDVEVAAAHEHAEQREVDVIAQRHRHAVADDLDVDRVERTGVRVLVERRERDRAPAPDRGAGFRRATPRRRRRSRPRSPRCRPSTKAGGGRRPRARGRGSTRRGTAARCTARVPTA